MIKFFRRIRQGLFIENKFSKYLLYAIGEIVLVVIGILIAVWINNWNEGKKTQQKELQTLAELKANLQSDLGDLEYNIANNKKRTNANEAIKKVLEEKIPYNDSLRTYIGNIFGNFKLTENTAAWENLKSVGIDLISNDSLRNNLTYLYANRYEYLEHLETNIDDKFQWDYLYPQILEHISIDTLWVSGSPRDYGKMLNDPKFYEVLKLNITNRIYMQNQYEKNRDLVVSLIAQIDRHTIAIKK